MKNWRAMTDRERAEKYQERAARYERRLRKVKSEIQKIAWIRVIAFLLMASCAFAGWYDRQLLPYGPLAILGGIAFVIAVLLHRRPFAVQPRIEARIEICDEAAARLNRNWDQISEDGSAFGEGEPYLSELQILGKGSVFEQIGRVHLPSGRARLAEVLKGELTGDLSARQAAAKELAEKTLFRQRFETEAKLGQVNTKALFAFLLWAESREGNGWFRAGRILPKVLITITWLSILLSAGFDLTTPWKWLLLGQFLVFFVTSRLLSKLYLPLLGLEGHLPLLVLQRLFHSVEEARFESPLLREMQTKLRETKPSKRLSGLTRVFESLSIRQSPLTYAIANIGFLVELQSCAALEQWRVEHGSKLRDELQMLSDFEVLLALGGYSYDHPRFCWPNVSADLPNPLTAKALGHPLFDDEKRKTNDFEIERGGQMNLITGSNMSGKSSFLRTVGLNAALAMAGAPVCADSFSLRPCRFSTSIQVTDDPSEGISRFYAEVKRIAQALREVEAAEEKKDLLPRLYLIDEMLSGTNSRERNIASEAILKRLCKAQRSFGLVTTHDLELAHLADEKSILCKHFSDRIEDGKLSFDYHLENGVSTTTNALYVLQLEGIRVGSDTESEA